MLLNGGDHAGPGPEGFAHREGGDDVAVVADADEEPVDDGESQGKNNGEGRALTGNRVDFDFAAQVFDVAAHHVHAHAAAGEIGHLLGGGKPRHEDHLVNSGGVGLFVGTDEAALAGLGQNAGGVEASTVVPDADADAAPLVGGAQHDGAEGKLACRHAFGGAFESVVHRVPHHVD